MANNPKAPGKSAGNTFKPDEIDGLLQLLGTIHRGGDVKTMQRIARSAPLVAVNRKFLTMRASIIRQLVGQEDG